MGQTVPIRSAPRAGPPERRGCSWLVSPRRAPPGEFLPLVLPTEDSRYISDEVVGATGAQSLHPIVAQYWRMVFDAHVHLHAYDRDFSPRLADFYLQLYEALPGAVARSANVYTPEQILLEGKGPLGSDVVVYDTDGAFVGAAVAEALAGSGHHVHMVTPHSLVSPLSDDTMDGLYLRPALRECGISCMTGTTLSAVAGDHVRCETAGEFIDLPADATVLVTYRQSEDKLYRQLRSRPEDLEANGIRAVHRAGDCVAPRILLDTVFDGHRLAREFDAGETPEVPLRPLPDRWR